MGLARFHFHVRALHRKHFCLLSLHCFINVRRAGRSLLHCSNATGCACCAALGAAATTDPRFLCSPLALEQTSVRYTLTFSALTPGKVTHHCFTASPWRTHICVRFCRHEQTGLLRVLRRKFPYSPTSMRHHRYLFYSLLLVGCAAVLRWNQFLFTAGLLFGYLFVLRQAGALAFRKERRFRFRCCSVRVDASRASVDRTVHACVS